MGEHVKMILVILASAFIPEFQQPAVGDLIPMSPGQFGLQVRALESNRSMLASLGRNRGVGR
jgi:hypothetical protein